MSYILPTPSCICFRSRKSKAKTKGILLAVVFVYLHSLSSNWSFPHEKNIAHLFFVLFCFCFSKSLCSKWYSFFPTDAKKNQLTMKRISTTLTRYPPFHFIMDHLDFLWILHAKVRRFLSFLIQNLDLWYF